MKIIYLVEVGVVDIIENNLFDENVCFFNSINDAKDFMNRYVKKGVKGTYGFIEAQIVDHDVYANNNAQLCCNGHEIDWHYTKNVIFSKVKIGDNIIEDLITNSYGINEHMLVTVLLTN